EALLSARALTLDALSYANKIRRDQALKYINPNHTEQQTDEVFGNELHDIIKKEGDKVKFINDALSQKRRSESFNKQQRGHNNNKSFHGGSKSNRYKTLKFRDIGGKLQRFTQVWQSEFGDHWASNIICEGYNPIWETPPPLSKQLITKPNQGLNKDMLQSKIIEMLTSG
ncbi:11984_t:CDS:2, partial [Acaulospora morrowiae]